MKPTTRRATFAAIVGILVTVAAVAAYQGRQQMIDTRPLLPLTFAHLDHREVNCITCHHNFSDDTGQGLCIDCHRTDPKVRLANRTDVPHALPRLPRREARGR